MKFEEEMNALKNSLKYAEDEMNRYKNMIGDKDSQINDLTDQTKNLNTKIEESYDNFDFRIRETIERTRI